MNPHKKFAELLIQKLQAQNALARATNSMAQSPQTHRFEAIKACAGQVALIDIEIRDFLEKCRQEETMTYEEQIGFYTLDN